MKICLLNTYDTVGGAARATVRLVNGLSSAGVDAKLLTRDSLSLDPSIGLCGSSFIARLRAFLDYLPVKCYRGGNPNNFSNVKIRSGSVRFINNYTPDLVHLHWVVQGLITIEELTTISCPIIWTLHDSWPFTGGCHLPGACSRYRDHCGQCPVLGSKRENDLSFKGWKSKQIAYKRKNIHFVAPSRWMAERAKKSSLLCDSEISVIPNGIDTGFFSPGFKNAARQKLGLPLEGNFILFGAKNILTDKNKGADYLWKALSLLPQLTRQTLVLILFGEDKKVCFPDAGIRMINFGIIDDDEMLVNLYRAADVFIMTSQQENFPNTIIEAMACGLPCIAFNVGGISEQIVHRYTSCLVEPYDVEALVKEIEWMLEENTMVGNMSKLARDHVVRNYELKTISKDYKNLYSRMILHN